MKQHPSIWQIGTAVDDGRIVSITGWGVGLCMRQCTCHRDPNSGEPAIFQDQTIGTLGLVHFHPCDCCEVWTAKELIAVARDVQYAENIPTRDEPKAEPA